MRSRALCLDSGRVGAVVETIGTRLALNRTVCFRMSEQAGLIRNEGLGVPTSGQTCLTARIWSEGFQRFCLYRVTVWCEEGSSSSPIATPQEAGHGSNRDWSAAP